MSALMNHLVRMDVNEDGVKTDDESWHLVGDAGGSNALLCTLEVFGYGEGDAETLEKYVERGGITCRKCLGLIKAMKAVRL